MTHPNPMHRELITNFVDEGGRFTRFMRTSFQIHPAYSKYRATGKYNGPAQPLNAMKHLTIPCDIIPGDYRHIRDMDIIVYNKSTVVTIAYKTEGTDLVFAAVSWHPDDSIPRDPFKRQQNLVHTVTRFLTAPVRIPLSALDDLQWSLICDQDEDNGDEMWRLGKNLRDVVWIHPELADMMVRKYGHHSKRRKGVVDNEVTSDMN